MPDKVLITKSKLDDLANAVAAKSGVPVTMTVDGMTDALLSIKMEQKSVTPKKTDTLLLPDEGYTGFAAVNVKAIPDEYVDVSDTTATANDVAEGKYFYTSNGVKTIGASSSALVVTITETEISETEHGWTIDRTFEEMKAAYENGSVLVINVFDYWGNQNLIAWEYDVPEPGFESFSIGVSGYSNSLNSMALILLNYNENGLSEYNSYPTPNAAIIELDYNIANGTYIPRDSFDVCQAKALAMYGVLFFETYRSLDGVYVSGYYDWNTSSIKYTIVNYVYGSGSYKLTNYTFNAQGTTWDTPIYLVDASDATATASDVVSGKTFYNSTGKVTGTIQTQAAATITPSTTQQTAVASGKYTTGDVVVSGDANLVAANIASGVSIFGVTGTHSGGNITVNPLSVNQNGTYTAPSGTAYSPVTVSVGGGVVEKDVNFIDYDGTLLYSYTAVEAQALSALPSNPSHTGLTAQGWNWTLAQIKTQLTNYPNSIVWVGQMYKTSDGKTRIYIDIPADANSYSFTVYFKQSVARGVTVDWGDGSATQTFTGTTATERSHTYASSGQYIITLEVTSGTITFNGASNYSIFGNSGSNAYSFKYGRITKIEFDDDAIIDGGYIFEYCYGLQEIVLPSGITAFGNSLFCDCKNLKAIILPDTVTSIGNSAFVNCINLQRVSIPYGVSSIGNNTFKGCSIKSITLSNSLTSIGGSAFYECRELDSIIVPINANPAATSSTYIFTYCTKLNSIVMYGFTSLPNYFLQYCTNLKKITLSNNLTSIGTNAFQHCNYIESLTIPSGVTSIGSSSFTNCFSIKTLYCLPTTPPTLTSNAFSPSDLKIVVPYSADHSVLQAYKTATNWVTYQSRMVEAEP